MCGGLELLPWEGSSWRLNSTVFAVPRKAVLLANFTFDLASVRVEATDARVQRDVLTTSVLVNTSLLLPSICGIVAKSSY